LIDDLPYGPGHLQGYQPIYEVLAGWEEDLGDIRRWEDLPQQAQEYILRVEKLSGVPVRLISVGPEREQIVEIN
jgi:adenylosuccinate synthase